ncbi:MAG: hypothetical protein RLZZ429_328 [Bacteroidota bacterium]|jgi:hypothetical protein
MLTSFNQIKFAFINRLDEFILVALIILYNRNSINYFIIKQEKSADNIFKNVNRNNLLNEH